MKEVETHPIQTNSLECKKGGARLPTAVTLRAKRVCECGDWGHLLESWCTSCERCIDCCECADDFHQMGLDER